MEHRLIAHIYLQNNFRPIVRVNTEHIEIKTKKQIERNKFY